MKRRHATRWVCEFCYRIFKGEILADGWDLIWQSAVCPDCQKRVQEDGGYHVVKGGAYAGRKRDPRERKAA